MFISKKFNRKLISLDWLHSISRISSAGWRVDFIDRRVFLAVKGVDRIKKKIFEIDSSCYNGKTDWSCCSSSNRCGLGGGDCDTDSDCKSGLVCGSNNCRKFNREASRTADCCENKSKLSFLFFMLYVALRMMITT